MQARRPRRPTVTAVPLLGAKLLPPTPGPFHLARPRLHERLRAALEGRATAVLAGPGYGKTGLVARFLQDADRASVWYTLDAADRDPWVFLSYIVHGLREHAPEFGERTYALWQEPRPAAEDVERLVDTIVSDAEETLQEPVILVLDGVHAIEPSEPCVRALKRLLAYLPGALHMILIGRSLPEIATRGMVADGSAHIIAGESLLFTPDETRTLLREIFKLPMTPEMLERAHARTRGWVTGLQLLRQTARLGAAGESLPEEVFARTESEIFDYFSEEVFAGESLEVRNLLLGASLPEIIDPDLCAEALTNPEVRSVLAQLVKRTLFISALESQGEYYAFDPLFRDFLRRKLRDAGQERKRELDLRYGRAFARRGAFPEAFRHLMAADDPEGVAELLATRGHPLLAAGMIDTVLGAARYAAARGVRAELVEDLIGEAARLAGDYTAAIGHFEKALASAGRAGRKLSGTERARALQGLAYSLLKKGDPRRAEATATEALAQAGEDDPELLARILNTLSIIRYRENRIDEAVSGWQQALGRARQAEDRHLVLMIAHNLGLPHAMLGDFRKASECFQILTGPDNARVGPQEGAAYLNLARIATIRGELSQAATLLDDAREIARTLGLQALAADVLEAEGNLLSDSGDFGGAAEKYTRAAAAFTELGQQDVLLNVEEAIALLSARRGENDQAERLGANVLQRYEASGDEEGIASARMALGEIRVRAGAAGAARELLEQAADTYGSLKRGYQECLAQLWLALACHRSGDRTGAEIHGAAALALAARFDYKAAVLRVAGLDDGFRRVLASLAAAPAYLEEENVPEPPALRASSGADLTVRLLGPVEIFRDEDRKIPATAWKIRRSLEVFCYLCCSRNHRASKDRIIEALWGDARPAVIDKNFHPTISYLRGALNHGHQVSKNFILYERGAYLLNPAYRYDIDVESFEERLRTARAQASRGEIKGALGAYDAALDQCHGPFMEEEYTEWTETPRTHVETLRAAALKETAELRIRNGEPEAAHAHLKELVETHPQDEDLSRRLMEVLGALGDRSGVEKEYRRLVRALDQHLRAAPIAATQRIYRTALAAPLPPKRRADRR